MLFIDCAGGNGQNRPQQKVGQLAYIHTGGQRQVNQIFDSCHRHACQRTVGKGRQQLRQVGKVQLNKSGHNGNGEFQKLQRKGNGRQHGNAGKPPGGAGF